ncbi:hypothetical protein TU77_02790 [Pseudomonas synxantha]|nr:hypothetical protein TU77_02790 [Pseudomonas synxantha]PRW70412.1 hypothetical protein C7A09_03405 [Pseudomonas fluorescens]
MQVLLKNAYKQLGTFPKTLLRLALIYCGMRSRKKELAGLKKPYCLHLSGLMFQSYDPLMLMIRLKAK